MSVHDILFIILLLLVALAAGRRSERVSRLDEWLSSRWAPWVAGAFAATLLGIVWGVRAAPRVHDEKAYLLQAELFSHFRWTGPGRVLPEFFEQAHVIVTPVLASKYPPGHSLLLAPSVAIGIPGLVPLALAALATALMFLLARRLAGPTVALLAVCVLMSSPDTYGWRGSYLSESTTSLCWLLAWWATLRWWRDEWRHGLLVAAAAVGWCAITRPLPTIAIALTLGPVILWRCAREHRWRELRVPLVVAIGIVAIIPLWSWRTTGDWKRTPLLAYTADYMPYDHPGFGFDTRPPRREIPPDLARLNAVYRAAHATHVVERLPVLVVERARAIVRGSYGAWTTVFVLLALIGLAAAPKVIWVPIATSVLHFILYLSYAHPAYWTLYYVEVTPLLAFLTALGVHRVVGVTAAAIARESPGAAWRNSTGQRAAFGARLAVIAFIWPLASTFVAGRSHIGITDQWARQFRQVTDQIPDRRALLIVRYAPRHDENESWIENPIDQHSARVLTAYDRGLDDLRLLRAFPDRVPYLFDENTLTLNRIATPIETGQSPNAGDVGAQPPDPLRR